MHKGFYENAFGNIIEVLRNTPVVDNEYESNSDDENVFEYADIFLMGACCDFAFALNNIFGYDIYEVRNDKASFMHKFCICKGSSNVWFVDVRGITTCRDEFYRGLIDSRTSYIIPTEDIYDGITEEGVKIARTFILNNLDSYSID